MKRNSIERPFYSTALVAQGAAQCAQFLSGPRALFPCFVSGPAVPCRCIQGDNLAMHRAIAQAQPGAVIVCDFHVDDQTACFGELMALECMRRKIAGAVIWGAVRDAAIIEQLKFPVFCTALSPMSPVKRRSGIVGKAITISAIRIKPGDQIIGDRDGVVLVPASKWLDAIASISLVRARERDIKRRMKTGAALSEILGIA